jgi:KaiC/GvpD/RAD55 family RecA-like ATPase
MKKIHEYQQELLISVMSQELPAFIRKGNYRDLSGSSAITLLPELYRAVITRLHEAGALFSKNSCAFPSWVDEEIRQVFVAVQGLPGYDRKEFRNLLHEIETGLLEERVKTNTSSAEVRPATADYPDVRQWYTRRSGEGIQLLIPEIKTVVGRLQPGEKMVIGGYAGSYKTVLLEHIVAAAIKESLMPVLFISSSRSRHEVRSRILDRMRANSVGSEVTENAIRQVERSLAVLGKEQTQQDWTLSLLHQAFSEILQATVGTVLIAIDSIDELAELTHPRRMKRTNTIASLLELLEHLSMQWGGRFTIISTIRFTEQTYLKLRRRVDEWEWQRRRAGFGFLDLANSIIARKMTAEQQTEMIKKWELTHNESELPPEYTALRKQHESQKALLEEIERKLKEDSADAWLNPADSQKGRYLISAFQDPPEVERFFDICMSLWAEPIKEQVRTVLALVLKNRKEETMENPCKVSFSKDEASMQMNLLPDIEEQRVSIESLIGDVIE